MSYKVNNVPLNAPLGSIVAYVNSTPPSGWLICNGTSIPAGVQYDALRSFLGTNTTPNLQAFFLRGIGNAPDIYDVSYNGPQNVRDVQLDAIRVHDHLIYYFTDDKDGGGNAKLNVLTVAAATKFTNTTGTETQPINYGVIWIIKA